MRPLQKLLATAVIAVVAYVSVGYAVLWVSVVTPEAVREVEGRPFGEAPPTRFTPAVGIVDGQVRDVFGDPVHGATVRLDGITAQTDTRGRFRLEGVPLGHYELRVESEGYRTARYAFSVIDGENNLSLRYDRGLWPVEFGTDFHAFYASTSPDAEVFIQLGMANGSTKPVYIRDFLIFDTAGEVLIDPFAEAEGYRHLALSYANLELVATPRLSVALAPGAIAQVEFRLPPDPTQVRTYHLVLWYGDAEAHNRGDYQVVEQVASLVYEPDYNPHPP